MKITTNLLIVLFLIFSFTALSSIATFITAKKFEKLSFELKQYDEVNLALTDFRAASRQITVEASESAYLSQGAERGAFEQAIERGEKALRKFQTLVNASEFQTEKMALNFTKLKQQLSMVLDFERAGERVLAQVAMRKAIDQFFKKEYLSVIKATQVAAEEENRAAQENYDQAAERLGLITPIALLIVLLGTTLLLTPLTFSFRRRLKMTLRCLDDLDFENNIFPELPVTGKDELKEISVRFNELTSKLKESKRQIVIQQQELVSSSRLSSLGEMAGGIAHEINNPLTIILGNASFIKTIIEESAGEKLNSKSLENVLRGLSRIETTSHRISKIVKGLRAFARDGAFDEMVDASIANIVEDTLALCTERFKAHGISLSSTCNSEVTIQCRPVQLGQVILNLLNNAHDAVINHENPWVKVETSLEDQNYIIRVTDSGVGIPQEIAEKMMQPFFTTKPVGAGTGLGLSISQGIIKAMDGELRLNRDCPHTQFVLRLPSRQPIATQKKAA